MKKLISLFVLLVLSISMVSASGLPVLNTGSTDNMGEYPVVSAVNWEGTSKAVASEGHSSGRKSCEPKGNIEFRGASSCYNPIRHKNIPAWDYGGECPEVNKEFHKCVFFFSTHLLNKDREFSEALLYWNSWEPVIDAGDERNTFKWLDNFRRNRK
jgi:hypothetical protein